MPKRAKKTKKNGAGHRLASAQRGIKRKATPPTKKRGPRSRVLPGFQGVRSQKLDNACETIAESRTAKNAAATSEKGAMAAAMSEMKRTKAHTYRHAGIVLGLLEGVDKLVVRLTKDTVSSGGDGQGAAPPATTEPSGG